MTQVEKQLRDLAMRTLEYVGVEGPERGQISKVQMDCDAEMRSLALGALRLLRIPVPKAKKFYPWRGR